MTPASKMSVMPPYGSFDFPGGSDSKVSACNEGDPGSIPGLEDPL